MLHCKSALSTSSSPLSQDPDMSKPAPSQIVAHAGTGSDALESSKKWIRRAEAKLLLDATGWLLVVLCWKSFCAAHWLSHIFVSLNVTDSLSFNCEFFLLELSFFLSFLLEFTTCFFALLISWKGSQMLSKSPEQN